MKIAYDHQIFTNQQYGGISRYFLMVIINLLKNEKNINVFPGFYKNKYISLIPDSVVHGFHLGKYPPKTGKIFQIINHCISQMQMKSWSPDLIHETYYSSMPRLNNNAIKITTAFDMIHELFKSSFPKSDQTSMMKKKTFQRVDHIISISKNTKKDLVEIANIEESKISVVHLGVDSETFKKESDTKNNNIYPYILYVGSRKGYKNFTNFITACSKSSFIRNKIKIIAFGGGGFNDAEKKLLHDLGFKTNFVLHFTGSDEKLCDLYNNALCFVYPSLYEGFGLPPLEAMASGCPVVSSNTSSMPEVINNAGIYFNPNCIEDMINSIENVILSESKRNELIKLGYKNIKNFSWESCAKKTYDVYKKIRR